MGYRRAPDYEPRQWCIGLNGVDIKKFEASSLTACAEEVRGADAECNTLFTFYTSKSTGQTGCGCVLKNKVCNVQEPIPDDTEDSGIFEVLQAIYQPP